MNTNPCIFSPTRPRLPTQTLVRKLLEAQFKKPGSHQKTPPTLPGNTLGNLNMHQSNVVVPMNDPRTMPGFQIPQYYNDHYRPAKYYYASQPPQQTNMHFAPANSTERYTNEKPLFTVDQLFQLFSQMLAYNYISTSAELPNSVLIALHFFGLECLTYID